MDVVLIDAGGANIGSVRYAFERAREKRGLKPEDSVVSVRLSPLENRPPEMKSRVSLKS